MLLEFLGYTPPTICTSANLRIGEAVLVYLNGMGPTRRLLPRRACRAKAESAKAGDNGVLGVLLNDKADVFNGGSPAWRRRVFMCAPPVKGQ